MGDLRPDNGGGTSDDGGTRPGGLPDLPPEWGTVIIPDDASELADEAAALRREIRREQRGVRVRSALGVPANPEGQPSLGIPVMIMAVAVLTTLVSLFVVTWGRQPSTPLPPVNGASAPTVPGTAAGTLADVVLVDASGVRVRLGTLLPAVFMLVDGCDCAPLVLATASAAPPGVRVVPVAKTAPLIADAPSTVRPLADADGLLRSRFAAETATAPASATAIIVDGTAENVIIGVDSLDDLTPSLQQLADR
jgi:hypothetical protein